jgi:myo-inositol-1(or 4)-monophosphatase
MRATIVAFGARCANCQGVELDARLEWCLTVAAEAGALAQSYFERREQLVIEHKGPQDLVSAADRDVETLIRARFAERFPSDGMLGEEQGGATAQSLWVVDPIDGTTNFLHGLPHWGISIAFVRDGVCELGVVHAPVLRETFVARRGGGATCNGKPISASACTEMNRAVIGFGSSKKHALDLYLRRLSNVLSQGTEYRRLGSAALNLASVACGRIEGYFEQHLSSWDALAGLLLVTEAGGRCRPFLEGEALTKGNVVLATNAALYETLAAATGIR